MRLHHIWNNIDLAILMAVLLPGNPFISIPALGFYDQPRAFEQYLLGTSLISSADLSRRGHPGSGPVPEISRDPGEPGPELPRPGNSQSELGELSTPTGTTTGAAGAANCPPLTTTTTPPPPRPRAASPRRLAAVEGPSPVVAVAVSSVSFAALLRLSTFSKAQSVWHLLISLTGPRSDTEGSVDGGGDSRRVDSPSWPTHPTGPPRESPPPPRAPPPGLS